MLQSLRDQWRRLRGQPETVAHFADWRALTDGSRPELDYGACILGQSSPGGTLPRQSRYEVYIHGKLVATRLGLSVAQRIYQTWISRDDGHQRCDQTE
jgi:hypothetical protein